MTAPVQRPSRLTVLRLLIDGAFLPVLCVPLGVAVIALSGMQNQYADILAQFVAPALIGTVGAVVMLLIARLRHSAALGGLAVAALALALWPQVFPDGPRPAKEGPTLTVYSANLHDENADIAAIRRSIDEANADVVVLIELAPEVIADLDGILGDYPHRAPGQVFVASSTVIASRWPLATAESPMDGLDAVIATAETPLGPVQMAGVHLTRPWPFAPSWGQISQTMALRQRLNSRPGSKLVVGDFNSVSSARIGRQVKTDLGLHPAPGFPGTWPGAFPALVGINIDQVYASDDLAFMSRKLGRDNGSDHRPVITRISRATR